MKKKKNPRLTMAQNDITFQHRFHFVLLKHIKINYNNKDRVSLDLLGVRRILCYIDNNNNNNI